MKTCRRGPLLIVLTAILALALAAQASAFTDVDPVSRYAGAIDELAAREIIAGYDNGNFGPRDPVTRQQFAKMIDLTLGLDVSEADISSFPDVPAGGSDSLYPDNYVAVAAGEGITQGSGDGLFHPGDAISRAQVVTMVVRALDSLHPDLLMEPEPYFPDPWGDFDPVHAPNALKAMSNYLLQPIPVFAVSPWDPMPREEVAQVLYNVLMSIEMGPSPNETPVEVTRVEDGDTIFVMYDGQEEEVRLIGIDAPELDEPFGQEAKDYLTELMGEGVVYLMFDEQQRDSGGRLLAYVYNEDVFEFANEALVREGLATVYTVPPNAMLADMMQQSEEEAKQYHRGMWGSSFEGPLAIASIHADASGDDSANLNDEYIVFAVMADISLKGYAVEDGSGHHYDFPNRAFTAGDEFKLHSGSGTNTSSDLYWGSEVPIWNDDGDTIKVLDAEGNVLLLQAY